MCVGMAKANEPTCGNEHSQPEVNHGESKPDGEGNETAADVHVVLVGHREDDDQQQEGAQDLVRCQGVQCHLG